MSTRWSATRRPINICGRKPKLSPEQIATVLAWAAIGTNQTQVAKKLGINPSTLNNYIMGRLKRPVRA